MCNRNRTCDNIISTIKKTTTTVTAVGISRPSVDQQNNNGNIDSGSWSRPSALLLGGKSSRRLIKLEARSPASDTDANNIPVCIEYPINTAPTEVIKIEEIMPRIVFDAPNQGRPSKYFLPPSKGYANLEPRSFLTIIGVPFANSNKNKILMTSMELGNNIRVIPHFTHEPLNIKLNLFWNDTKLLSVNFS